MAKLILVLLSVCFVSTIYGNLLLDHPQQGLAVNFPFTEKMTVQRLQSPTLDMCPTCYDLMNEAVDQLLNQIANGGVVGGCESLCAILVNPLLVMGCNLVCDYVGLNVFVDAINVTDPDPIYICQVIDLCPEVQGGAVTINSAVVSPSSGPQNTTFAITLTYTVTAATGPGLLALQIVDPSGGGVGTENFQEGQAPGKYALTWQMQAEPSEQEPFTPGKYQVALAVCEGDCTTSHPNGGVYAETATSFAITQ